MGYNKTKKALKILTLSTSFLFSLTLIANPILNDNYQTISGFLGQTNYITIEEEGSEEQDTIYYPTEFKSVAEQKANSKRLCEAVVGEGAVLLKNDNNALPIKTSAEQKAKVSLFSASSIDLAITGGGSGANNTQDNVEIGKYIEDIQSAVNDKISISAAVIPNEKQYYVDADSIYEYARHLIKNNKSKGTGVISFFTEEDFAKTLSNIELIEELEKSVYSNDFEGFYLVYQPQIDARTHRVISAEVLLRYKSPTKGLVFPNDFIPLLERTQMIREVGMWVLDKALDQCVKWRKKIPDMHISVNFSPVQLKDEDITDKVFNAINKHGLPTNALTLELTECVELEDTSVYSDCFSRLRNAGVHIAIDDFGTGYANLSYLKKVQADQLKIDQLFVKDVRQGSLNFTLINNVVQFARANGFSVCMEGVETVA